jgi:hypothetical protein
MPGLLGGMVRTAVVAGTATAVSNRVSRRQAERWAQEDQSAYAQPQYAEPQYVQQAPPPAASDSDDMFEQLQKLAELRDKGILTDDEFAAQKARILAG